MTSQTRLRLHYLASALLGSCSRSSCGTYSVRAFSSSAAPPGQSAAIIKQLRERSGAPISDVKSTLVEHGWDVDKAYEALRKKGLAAAAKKASRHAAEGLIGASFAASAAGSSTFSSSSPSGAGHGGAGSVVVVELNSETDFVARNSLFQDLLRQVMAAAHALGSTASVAPDHSLNLDQLLAAPTPGGASVSEAVTQVAAQVRENVRLRRAYRVDSGDGLVFPYVHQAASPGLGKLASVVVLRAEDGRSLAGLQDPASASGSQLQAAGEGLAMHVAGMRPSYLNRGSVPADVLAKERDLLAQGESLRGKPPQVVTKMVEGRLAKQLAEWCLVEQRYVMDDTITVQELINRLRKETGAPLAVSTFLRVQCGEGLGPKGGDDFATEVARIVSET